MPFTNNSRFYILLPAIRPFNALISQPAISVNGLLIHPLDFDGRSKSHIRSFILSFKSDLIASIIMHICSCKSCNAQSV